MTDAQLRSIFFTIAARATNGQLEELLAASKHASYCSAQLGINAQLQAHYRLVGACDSVIDDMSNYDKRMVKKYIAETLNPEPEEA